jgi:hypothetical protein
MAENPRTEVSELLITRSQTGMGYGQCLASPANESAMSLTVTSVYGDDA